MKKNNLEDTIAAISTASGQGGIGIVRISGDQALSIAKKIFFPANRRPVSEFKSYTLHYGKIMQQGRVLDEVILALMRKPKSYTREDVVEINCHGGDLSTGKILDLVLDCGARLAAPGEFTKRAFLNGRIDLAQAEAVIDIIQAKTDSALKISLEQLGGGLSKEINLIRKDLLDILAILEASIDFPEELIPGQATGQLASQLLGLRTRLEKLLAGANCGRILRQGLHVVICGKPNVGKSSLLNALLKKERAIVTAQAGTTRDTIEEMLDIKGIPVRIVDTAGILKPRNLIEKKAVKRSQKEIKAADLVIILFDASKKLSPQDWQIVRSIKNKMVIAVANKIDLKIRLEIPEIKKIFPCLISLCAKKSKNINLLEDALYDLVTQGKLSGSESILVSNLRHLRALKDAQKLICQAQDLLKNKMSVEFVAWPLKEAGMHLDKILGKDIGEDLLDKIFTDFCIGK